MIGLGTPTQRLAEGGGADRHQHELLEVDGVLGVGAPVQHVQHRHRQRVRVGAAHGPVERDLQVVGHRLGAGQGDGQHRVGPEPSLVGRPVEVDEGEVDRPLVEGVQAAERPGDLAIDVGHGALHALAAEAAAPVAQLDRLADTGRRTGGSDGMPAGAGVQQHLGFHGRVATRVEHLAPDHVLNGAHEFSPSASSLNGHRCKRLAVCPAGFGDALRPERWRRAGATHARAARARHRSPAVGPGLPPRRGTPPPRRRDRPRRATAGRRRAAPPSPRPRPTARGMRPRDPISSAPGGSKPTERALRASFAVNMRAGSPSGIPSVTLWRPFSCRLISSQLATTCSASVASTSPNTCGCRWTSLSWTPRATPARSNWPSSRARRAWNTIWKSRSPSSSSRWA